MANADDKIPLYALFRGWSPLDGREAPSRPPSPAEPADKPQEAAAKGKDMPKAGSSGQQPPAEEVEEYLPVWEKMLCWRCGSECHTRHNCNRPFKLFCSRCGKVGVMSRHCTCPPVLKGVTPPTPAFKVPQGKPLRRSSQPRLAGAKPELATIKEREYRSQTYRSQTFRRRRRDEDDTVHDS